MAEPVDDQAEPLTIGPVAVGPIAHGGHFVARHEGRVVFVRHALPGERVMIAVTDISQPSYWRGDAIEILDPSPDRIQPACPISGPGGCGGCDFQHVDPAAQRRLKAEVLAEQLRRLAGLELRVPVEEVPFDGRTGDGRTGDGLGWRTRMRYLFDDAGHPGLRAHRSHQVIALPPEGCRIAAPAIGRPATGTTGGEVIGVDAADGVHWLPGGRQETITEHAVGRDWEVSGDGFWQVHPAAADLLATTVLEGLQPDAGEKAFDLYCGVGLFTGALVDAGCRVIGVESSGAAVAAARRNLADAGSRARFQTSRVDRALGAPRGRSALPGSTDLVVLDPPRSGAGRKVVEQIVRRRPRAIAYVACDPAALARDLGYLQKQAYELVSLRAFDLFPMTQHFECVAILRPSS
ncbi:class I SAM-dependent RNA methyltransferase [Microlunatus endophyticus]|uniref:class I SAM-dependent RNA methyltransferase n=1 Tax=Microlunatus endophyticus TaxID=1716077 RepID=UPI001E4EC912|nr:TRAM domain-containing protein [Microlunatus endophyticus]